MLLVAALFGAGFVPFGSDLASAQSTTENELVSSEPADGDTVAVSPDQLTFTFAEALGPDDVFSAPVGCGSATQSTGIPVVGSDRTQVTVEVLGPFPRGACAISWLLRDGLGESIDSGVITFSVQSAPTTDDDADADNADNADDEAPAPTPTTPSPSADAEAVDEGSSGGALWLGRVISTTAILALFGALALVGTAWPEGPEYVITMRFLRSLWALALIGTLLFVVAFTADVSGRAFGSSLSPGGWFDLADAGWPGRAALARLVLVIASGWVVLRPERVIDPTTQLPAFVIPALAVVSVGLARTGGDFAVVGSMLAILHALGAAVWLGGALLVARVVVAGPGEEDLVHAVRGFNRVSAPAIAITVVTGVFQMFRLVGGGLFTTGHGQVLVLKTVVVAVLIFLAMTTRQMVSARLRRADEMSAPAADRFRRAYTAEAGIGVVVLAFSGWLLALQPAQIDDRAGYAIERQFTDTESGLDVIVSVTPARTGLNGLRVEVNAPQDGISNLVVAFIPPAESGVDGIEQPIPLTTAGTAVLDTDVGLPFSVPGTWRMEVTGATRTGVSEAQTSFTVTGDEIDLELTPGGATTGDGTTDDGTAPSDDDTTDDPADSPTVITIDIDDDDDDDGGDGG